MERFLWRFIAGHPFMPACLTAEGTEMRVDAFADHKGGAGGTAAAIGLPAARAKASHRIPFIDLNPPAGAIGGPGVRDSRTALSIPQALSASPGVALPWSDA